MDCTNYLNGLVPCRKHTLKDIGSELAHHLQRCLPEGSTSIRKKFYCRVTVLLKESYPNCSFGEEGAGGVVKRDSNVIRKRRERKIKTLAESKNANRMLNISGINDASFDDDIQCALVQRVPDLEHIRCLVRNMRCSLPYLEHKDHLFHLEIIMDEFEKMNIIKRETALDKLMQVVDKLYPGMPIAPALINFHNSTTRRGVLCPVVIDGAEDIIFSPGPCLILAENVKIVDKVNIIAIGQRHNDALHVLQLLAYYYIMDSSYPRLFGGASGLLQHYVLQLPFDCMIKLWLKKCKIL